MVEAHCGHEVDGYDQFVTVRFGGWSCDAVEGFLPCVEFYEYCPSCAISARARPDFLADEDAENAYFAANRRERKNNAA